MIQEQRSGVKLKYTDINIQITGKKKINPSFFISFLLFLSMKSFIYFEEVVSTVLSNQLLTFYNQPPGSRSGPFSQLSQG